MSAVCKICLPRRKFLFKPQSGYIPQCSKLLSFELFPNSFYFLVGILPLFATRRSPLRLHYKNSKSVRPYNKICLGANNQFGLKDCRHEGALCSFMRRVSVLFHPQQSPMPCTKQRHRADASVNKWNKSVYSFTTFTALYCLPFLRTRTM